MAMSLRQVLNSNSVENSIIFHSSEHTDALDFLVNFKPNRIKRTSFPLKLIGNVSMKDTNLIFRGIHKADLLQRKFFASEVFSFSDLQNKKFLRRVNISKTQHEYAFFELLKADLMVHQQTAKLKTYGLNGFHIKNFDSAVAIHMRFGDFLEQNIAAQYGNLDVKYYSKAINSFRNNGSIHDIEIQLFSDDIKKGKKLLAQMGCAHVNTFEAENLKPEEELLIMSQYSRLIISNSTFSWWAGYLAEDSATVIAPNPLMKNAASNLSRSPNWTYIDGWL
jgi:hypothetical protein